MKPLPANLKPRKRVMKNKFRIYIFMRRLFVLAVSAGFTLSASALDIHVEVKNGTTGALQGNLEEVRLLSLTTTMEVVQSYSNAGPRIDFQDVSLEKAPMLVQVIHQGVTYSERVHIGSQSDKVTIPVSVYDRNNATDRVTIFKMIVLRYLGNYILVQEDYYIDNQGSHVFSEKGETPGFYFKTPEGAQIFQVLASLGDEADESNMLRVNVEPVPGRETLYKLPMGAPPGTKIYRVLYIVGEYTGESFPVSFESYYSLSDATHLVLLNELQAKDAKDPGRALVPAPTDLIDVDTIQFPKNRKSVDLVLFGGESEPLPDRSESGGNSNSSGGNGGGGSEKEEFTGRAVADSPAGVVVKIFGAVVLVILALAFAYYLGTNPAWLQIRRIQSKGRLEYSRDQLLKLNLSEEVKAKKLSRIESKLKTLESLLEKK